MRVVLKGIHTVRSGGKVYVYAWRGGPRIKAAPGTPEFMAEYNRVVAGREAPSVGTMFGLIAAFKASSEFTTRAEKTRRDYLRYLTLIEERFGRMPLAALQHPMARGEFKRWRDEFAAKPRTADYAWTVLARVLSVAKDNGTIEKNVCERGGRLYEADRTEKVWRASDIEAFVAVASPPLSLALLMALWTGQREGDLLRLPWSAYDGKVIRLRQSKTGQAVRIPCGQVLRETLDALPRKSAFGPILLNTREKAWTSDGFRTSWGKACGRAGIEDLTFHDLRGTAVTRLAVAGCSNAQIASFTGHSLRDVHTILDAHYLGRDMELAETALKLLERKERRSRRGDNSASS